MIHVVQQGSDLVEPNVLEKILDFKLYRIELNTVCAIFHLKKYNCIEIFHPEKYNCIAIFHLEKHNGVFAGVLHEKALEVV